MSQRRVPRDAAKESWWREQVRVQIQSGLSVRAYCRQQQLSEPSFYAWRKELSKRDQEHLPSAPTPPVPATNVRDLNATRPTFTEVILTSPTADSPTSASPIEIILTAGQRILVAPGFDSLTLQAVLEVLERPRSEESTPC